MRPNLGRNELLAGRATRPAMADSMSPNVPLPTTPVSCFITTEAQLDALEEVSAGSCRPKSPHERQLPEGLPSSQWSPARYGALRKADADDSESSSARSEYNGGIAQGQSLPLTPSLSAISVLDSAISSTSSRRGSLTTSSADLNDSANASEPGHQIDEPTPRPGRDNAMSQLIMPSLIVPRRRPFTDAGKALGKLKILMAGQPGTSDCTHQVGLSLPLFARNTEG